MEYPTPRQAHVEDADEEYKIQFPTYDAAAFNEIDAKYRSGEKLINVSASGCVMKVVVKTMQDIVEQLNTILQLDKMVTFDPIRKFILL